MKLRLGMIAWVITVISCGCASIGTIETARYSTVVSDNPARDSGVAARKTAHGVKLLKKGKLEQAEQTFKDALIADVTYGPAHNNLGQVYYSQDRFYLAAWEFEYSRKLMPERSEPLNNLGLTYEAAGQADEAIEYFQMAVATNPEDPELIGNLVRAMVRRGDRSLYVNQLLQGLVFRDSRPSWVDWANEQLAMLNFVDPAQAPTSSGNDNPVQAPISSGNNQFEKLPSPLTLENY